MLERIEHLERPPHGGVTSHSGQIRHGAYSTGIVLKSWVVEAHGLRSLLVHTTFQERPVAVSGGPADAE
jgi:hypothetical protein